MDAVTIAQQGKFGRVTFAHPQTLDLLATIHVAGLTLPLPDRRIFWQALAKYAANRLEALERETDTPEPAPGA